MTVDTAELMAAILERLQTASTAAYQYPDPRHGPQDVAASQQQRDEETDLWNSLVGTHTGALALDAGCGLGVHTPRLRERYSHVLSVDGDPARLAVARSVWGETASGVFRCVRLDDPVLGEPAFAGRFSFIQCMQVLGHVPIAAQATALRLLAGMLADGAPLVLAVPFTNGLGDEFCKTLLTADGMSDGIPIPVAEFDALARAATSGVLPVHHFSVAGVQRLVRQAGLRMEHMEVYNTVGPTRADVMLLARR